MSEPLMLKIESCHDCPRLKVSEVRSWQLGNQPAYEYCCTKANRLITPNEGVNPPPSWCPIRQAKAAQDESAHD